MCQFLQAVALNEFIAHNIFKGKFNWNKNKKKKYSKLKFSIIQDNGLSIYAYFVSMYQIKIKIRVVHLKLFFRFSRGDLVETSPS
jgi:hypothetical protein